MEFEQHKHTSCHRPVPSRSRLGVALLTALLLPMAGAALAQSPQETAAKQREKATELDKVTVTGSLIPQSQVETFVPISTISAEDIKVRGFSNVAEVLQQSSFSTGSVQGAQSSASFTQGAETMSMFGLPPGYVKYLIDGRPMANYPALYNGSETFNNISGIPIDLVDRIEILPGGQSSLYGSDAIAGVINFILKKRMDGTSISARGGSYSKPGGDAERFSLASGLSFAGERGNLLFGVQHEHRDPIWGYQREQTSRIFEHSINRWGARVDPVASRNFLVYGRGRNSYRFLDPNNCANILGHYGGSIGLYHRVGNDQPYCGSLEAIGYRTLRNEKEAQQGYAHLTFDISEGTRLYFDALYSKEKVKYNSGSSYLWWGTQSEWGYYYDPDLGELLNLQRAFAPEDIGGGGFKDTMSRDESRAYHVTAGLAGAFGGSGWEYDASYTRTHYALDEYNFVRWNEPVNAWFRQNILGPELGVDPRYGVYPVFRPNYDAFYRPISPEAFRSFTGYALSESRTSDDTVRAQITQAELFSLPGGDAGLALVAEWGRQKWDYTPHQGLLNGDVWGATAVSGGGERDRYAVTGELRLPLWDMLTLSTSARYDAFKPDGGDTIDKPTYSVGLEFRPLETLLLRGKYGTAFRAPTLSDLYQGRSGYYTSVTDYYGCSQAGFDPLDPEALRACPASLYSRQIFGTQSGSLDLDPINAKVWSAGVVWSPFDRFSLEVDYHDWDISDEVAEQSIDRLLMQEYRCRSGLENMGSAQCQATLGLITRDAQGDLEQVHTPKINVSNQQLKVVTATLNYGFDVGQIGSFSTRVNFTQKLSHDYQEYDDDEYIDLLNSPFYRAEPKCRGEVSLSWNKGNWSSTLYANWMEKTPNYRARVIDGFDDPWLDPQSRGNTPEQVAATDRRATARWLGSYTTYNWSLNYSPIEALSVSLLVNNLFDNKPPFDPTYPATTGSPYNSDQYHVYGRSFFIEASYRFGGSEH